MAIKRKPVLKSVVKKQAQKKPAKAKVSKQELIGNLHDLEPLRIKVRNFAAAGLVLVAPAVLSLWLESNLVQNILGESVVTSTVSWGGMIAAGIAGAIILIMAWMKYRSYKAKFKEDVVRHIFHAIAPQLKYSPSNHISQGIYHDSQIFRKKYDRYNGDDHVKGKIGDTDIEFSELHTEYYTTTQTKNGSRKQWHTIFKGLFFTADFHKNIGGETYILPDFAEKRFGVFGKFLQKKNPLKHAKHLVQLENPIFEKEFAVYSSDEQEARYCLTPKMMEDMMVLKNNFPKSKMYCSIRGTQINIALTMSNQFEPRVWRKGADPKQIDQMAELIKSLTSIVEQLNLNTRIWTKKAA